MTKGEAEERSLPAEALGVPRALIALAAIHAVASWLVWLDRYRDLSQEPLTAVLAILGLLGVWGLLLVWIMALVVLWRAVVAPLASRMQGQDRSPVSLLQRVLEHLGVWVSLLLLSYVLGMVMPNVRLMTWLFCALWLLGFGATGSWMLLADVLQPQSAWLPRERRFATSSLLAPTAALGWSMFVVFELLFHYYAANFVLFEDITMFLTVMSDEAINMVFGPNAPWFATALVVYALIASLTCMILVRRRRSRPVDWVSGRPLAVVLASGFAGLALLFVVPSQDARIILHHIHPQGDDLAGFMVPLRAPGPEERAAAERLYPDLLSNTDGQLAPTSLSRETLAEYGARASGSPVRHKNVIVVFIDTLSRRNLDAWGYERAVAPRLKELADRSTRFDGARSNGGTTDLATVALFYGVRPLFGETKSETYLHGHGGLPFHLLAGSAGVQVGIFSGDWEVWDQGNAPLFPDRCDHFLDARLAQESRADEVRLWSGLREDLVVDELIKWLNQQAVQGNRSLAYLKFLRPHIPYYTPPTLPDGWSPPFLPQAEGFSITDLNPSADRQLLTRNRYDNSVNFVDHQLGRLLDYLEKSGRSEDTAILLVADHGEAWGQHGWFTHGYQNYEEFLEVPLILHEPGAPPKVDRRPVALMDVGPTVLDLLGFPVYGNYQGESLLRTDAHSVFWADSNSAARLTTLEVGPWKYTENLLTTEATLFHMERDPQERNNLAYTPEYAERRSALRALLYEGNALQLAWARELRSESTSSLLEASP
jgi:hypothetical protein